MIKKLLLTLIAMLCAMVAPAQENLYILQGNKVIGAYPVTDIDSVTFKLTGNVDANLYNITTSADRMCTISTLSQAVPGQTVIVNVTVTNARYKVESLTANGEACTYITDNGETWRYKFVMPEGDVALRAGTVIDYHDITPYASAHAYITMLNCCDNWDAPENERIFNEALNGLVKFYYGADAGYEVSIRAYSESGEELEIQYTDEDMDFGKCYFVAMPDEPITIEVTAKELITYRGMDFVGKYSGYELLCGTNNLYAPSAATFSAELKGNTAYTAADTRDGAFSAEGMYTYSTGSGIFTYVEPSTDQGVSSSKGYALNGRWIGADGNAFFWFSDLDEDKPENTRLFVASQNDFDYACAAADSYGTRYLVEISRINGHTYYYIDTRTREITPVTILFTSGENIAAACKGRAVSVDDESAALFAYELASAGATPVFTFAGNEAGTYTAQSGTDGGDLVLDGLGCGTYNGTSGTYTANNNLITFTANGTTWTFVIDPATATYTSSESEEWDGPLNFKAESTSARYDDATPTSGYIVVALNQNFAGKAAEGKAKVQGVIADSYGKERETTAATVSYVYDAAKQIITLSGVLVGTADGRSSERIDIELEVSSDKQSLTCTKNVYLRAASGGNTRYIPMQNLTFTATE